MKNAGSTFTNHGTVTGGVTYNGGVINNLGTMTSPIQIALTSIATNVSGVWYMNADYTIKPGYALTISPAGIVFNTNQNNIVNNGSIIIDTNGTLLATGYLDNYGTISIGVMSAITTSSTITNHPGGIINNSGAIVVTSGFNNYGGTINNIAGSSIAIYSPAIFNNESNIANNGLFQNYGGTVYNSGSIAPNPVQNA
jgi:hypothetical protein